MKNNNKIRQYYKKIKNILRPYYKKIKNILRPYYKKIKNILRPYYKKIKNILRPYYKKLVSAIRQFVMTEIAKMRMRVGIKAVQAIHKYQSKKYLNPDYKTLRQYIVLLERPVRKKKYYLKRKGMKVMLMYKTGTFTIEERLFWINTKNFKKIRRAGWLPRTMKIEALKEKAFYTSSLERNYQEQYKAKQHAINKYITYLKSK